MKVVIGVILQKSPVLGHVYPCVNDINLDEWGRSDVIISDGPPCQKVSKKQGGNIWSFEIPFIDNTL